jgi:hypothetical protein
VRFADDFIIGFEHYADAERLLGELRERLQKFSLELHADKTRLIEFGRYANERRELRGEGKAETFDFLGFTHMCAELRTGKFIVKRTTVRQRMRNKLREVKTTLQQRRHLPIPVQGAWLGSVVRGFNAYYGVPTNVRALASVRAQIERHWLRSLRRRGQRDRTNWRRLRVLSDRWIPAPRIMRPWPYESRYTSDPRQEPGAVIPPAGICAGGGPNHSIQNRHGQGRVERDGQGEGPSLPRP